MNDIYKSAGIIIQNRKLLISRTKGKSFFIAPGGKKDINETDEQALIRELHEELSITVEESNLEDFGTWRAEAIGMKDTIVHMHVFMVRSYEGTIAPSHEIEEVKWFNSSDLTTIELGSIFKHDVVPKLLELDLID